MSSLGDLLLGKAHDKTSSPNSDEDGNEDDKFYANHGSQSRPREPKTEALPEIKREPDDGGDAQSNASSTDDYVRELLDPNDRPRNVWHVVEGPKQEHTEDGRRSLTPNSENMDTSKSPGYNADRSKNYPPEDSYDDKVPPPPTPPIPVRDDDGDESNYPEQDREEKTSINHKSDRHHRHDRDSKSHRDRSKDKSPSSHRRHHSRGDRDRDRDPDKRRDRNRDRSRDRDRDRDYNRRDRSRKSSSRRKFDISDDEDDYDRHGRHRSRRNRKRSRSRSRSSSRRTRRRSKSDSQSPITRRNSRTVLLMQLSPRVTSKDLENFFADIGRVREVRLIMDSKTRRHKGIAYIEFDDTTSASKALALNGQKFFGLPMSIQSALTDRNKGDWTGTSTHISGHYTPSHSSSRGNLPPDSYRVYVGSLHTGITEDMLRSLFEPFGPILRLELMRDRTTSLSRGYAFITFANIDDGQYAVQNLDGLELGGKCIRVSKSTEKSEHTSSSHV